MEVPQHLKGLYRHWSEHTADYAPRQAISSTAIFNDQELFTNISQFIDERMSIWHKKTAGYQPPYTKDNILQTYRFCNIYREFDRQTIDIHEMLNPIRDDFDLWLLNMFYCRMVAMPKTCKNTGLLSYDEKHNQDVYQKLKSLPAPKYGVPYVFPISTIMRSKTPTRELFLTRYLTTVMKKIAKEIRTWKKKSVYDGIEKILPLFGFNLSFLWTEVLIDVAYQYPEHIDLFARFPIGPGAAPTMKRIDDSKDPSILVAELARMDYATALTYDGKQVRISAENWEGIGCEFRKYTNLKQGTGRRRIYSPKHN